MVREADSLFVVACGVRRCFVKKVPGIFRYCSALEVDAANDVTLFCRGGTGTSIIDATSMLSAAVTKFYGRGAIVDPLSASLKLEFASGLIDNDEDDLSLSARPVRSDTDWSLALLV